MHHGRKTGSALALGLILALSACASFPELDRAGPPVDPNAAFPAILPIDPILARADGFATTPELTADQAGRAARLRARAARMRGPVVDAATKERLRDMLARTRG